MDLKLRAELEVDLDDDGMDLKLRAECEAELELWAVDEDAVSRAKPKKRARVPSQHHMVVIIKAPFCKETNIVVAKDDLIENVKAKIQDEFGIPIGKQRLISKTQTLEDGRKLSDYNILPGDMLMAMPPSLKLPSSSSSSRC